MWQRGSGGEGATGETAAVAAGMKSRGGRRRLWPRVSERGWLTSAAVEDVQRRATVANGPIASAAAGPSTKL